MLYVSLTNLYLDVVVDPRLYSLHVGPLGLRAGEMYSIPAIYIRTPLTPPCVRISPLNETFTFASTQHRHI